MSKNTSKIISNEVESEFNKRAKLFKNNSSVLDSSNNKSAIFSNIFRDFSSKFFIKQNTNINKTDIVLDFGCGIGRITKMLSQNAKFVYGYDNSVEMLNVAKEKNNAENIFYSHNLNHETNNVTKIMTFWVLQHVSDDEIKNIVLKFVNSIKQNGYIYLFEQVKVKKETSNNIIYQRNEENYIKLFDNPYLKFIKSKPILRMPSYSLHFWNKIKLNNIVIKYLLLGLEKSTLNYKRVNIDYETRLFVFQKIN